MQTITELNFSLKYQNDVPVLGTTDFFGVNLSTVVDERRPLIFYKNKLKARAIRCYLVGHFKRRITAFEAIGHQDKHLIERMKRALNSLQYDVFTNYSDFQKYIWKFEPLLKSTLPKKADKSHAVINYIYTTI